MYVIIKEDYSPKYSAFSTTKKGQFASLTRLQMQQREYISVSFD